MSGKDLRNSKILSEKGSNQRFHPYLKKNDVKEAITSPEKTKCENNNVESKTCPICLDSESLSEIDFLPCCHKFHKTCLLNWLKYNVSCPICRIKLKNFLDGDDDLSDSEEELLNRDQSDLSEEENIDRGSEMEIPNRDQSDLSEEEVIDSDSEMDIPNRNQSDFSEEEHIDSDSKVDIPNRDQSDLSEEEEIDSDSEMEISNRDQSEEADIYNDSDKETGDDSIENSDESFSVSDDEVTGHESIENSDKSFSESDDEETEDE